MSLKNLFPIVVLSMLLAACSGGNKSQDETTSDADMMDSDDTMEESMDPVMMTVDADQSEVMWEGTMMGMYSHEGVVKIKEGELEMKGNEVTGGTFVVDLTSITPTDDAYNPEEGKTKEKLVGHLSSDDFFNVEEYPEAKFMVSSYDPASKTLKGELTIRGNTHEETVEDVTIDKDAGTATGKLTFDRTKYDVSFQHPAQEMVLSDDIELKIKLNVKPKA